jgi:hypothetical protein
MPSASGCTSSILGLHSLGTNFTEPSHMATQARRDAAELGQRLGVEGNIGGLVQGARRRLMTANVFDVPSTMAKILTGLPPINAPSPEND